MDDIETLDDLIEISHQQDMELDFCKMLLTFAYSKLYNQNFSKQEDALNLDRLNNYLQYGVMH